MAVTILVVGATGNTGRSVVETLSTVRDKGGFLSGCRIIAQTRSKNSTTSQELAKLPGVEVEELHWVDITTEWLRSHGVSRAFIAAHNSPTQFPEESNFHLAALRAGVEYVVRISTTAANVHPDCGAFYARTHWAIEAMLESPNFEALQWTSLQPNIFTSFVLPPVAQFIQHYRDTQQQDTLSLLLAPDAPVGIIDPRDVGVIAAQLLAQSHTTKHNRAKYVLNGPEDITGNSLVQLAEQKTGTKVAEVRFKDTSGIEAMASASPPEARSLIRSIVYAPVTAWEGLCTASTTSREVLELAAAKRTVVDALDELLG